MRNATGISAEQTPPMRRAIIRRIASIKIAESKELIRPTLRILIAASLLINKPS